MVVMKSGEVRPPAGRQQPSLASSTSSERCMPPTNTWRLSAPQIALEERRGRMGGVVWEERREMGWAR